MAFTSAIAHLSSILSQTFSSGALLAFQFIAICLLNSTKARSVNLFLCLVCLFVCRIPSRHDSGVSGMSASMMSVILFSIIFHAFAMTGHCHTIWIKSAVSWLHLGHVAFAVVYILDNRWGVRYVLCK